MREVISTGNALIARAAIDCGCNFFGGYPITPSSEVLAPGFLREWRRAIFCKLATLLTAIFKASRCALAR